MVKLFFVIIKGRHLKYLEEKKTSLCPSCFGLGLALMRGGWHNRRACVLYRESNGFRRSRVRISSRAFFMAIAPSSVFFFCFLFSLGWLPPTYHTSLHTFYYRLLLRYHIHHNSCVHRSVLLSKFSAKDPLAGRVPGSEASFYCARNLIKVHLP